MGQGKDQDGDGELTQEESPAPMIEPARYSYDSVGGGTSHDWYVCLLAWKSVMDQEFWGGDAIDEDEKLEISDQDIALGAKCEVPGAFRGDWTAIRMGSPGPSLTSSCSGNQLISLFGVDPVNRYSVDCATARELKAWESGKYHADQAISELIRLADKNHDSKISLEDL
eukprot:3672429-Amphidinium_carterae.1